MRSPVLALLSVCSAFGLFWGQESVPDLLPSLVPRFFLIALLSQADQLLGQDSGSACARKTSINSLSRPVPSHPGRLDPSPACAAAAGAAGLFRPVYLVVVRYRLTGFEAHSSDGSAPAPQHRLKVSVRGEVGYCCEAPTSLRCRPGAWEAARILQSRHSHGYLWPLSPYFPFLSYPGKA